MDKVKWLKGIISGLKDSIEEYESNSEINPDVANEIVAGTNVLITYIEELERLVEKVSRFENVADELQEELIEKDEEIERLRNLIKGAVSIAEAQHENFLFEPWNSLKAEVENFTKSK